jgi:hypothetical protein
MRIMILMAKARILKLLFVATQLKQGEIKERKGLYCTVALAR